MPLLCVSLSLWSISCSPEVQRERDGGPGADVGNKPIVATAKQPDPRAADTTLWPGRAPAPVERLAAGTMTPPRTGAAAGQATPQGDRRSFDQGTAADPRQQSGGGARRP